MHLPRLLPTFSGRVRPALLIALAALAAHHEVLSNDFIVVDDTLYVTDRPEVRAGLSARGVVWAFLNLEAYNWHPLTWISHMADVSLWGLQPFGHHLTNWLLHAANALLVWAVFRRAAGSTWRSAAVALLFAVHPVHVESVAWVAERKDLLSALLFLVALLAYVGPDARPTPRGYALGLASFALGLMAKPMIVMTPVLLLLLDVWPLRRLTLGRRPLVAPWTTVVSKAPFFVLSAAVAAVTVIAQDRSGRGMIIHDSPLSLNVGNAIISYVRYLRLLIWPEGLAFSHPLRVADITLPAVVAAAATLVAITALCIRVRHSHPSVLFGWLWYLLALLPVIGLLRFGYQALAERYLYLPAIGIYVAIVWGTADLIAERVRARRVVGAALAVALAALGALTMRYEEYWRSTIPLLERAIEIYPHNPMPRRVLGSTYAMVGRLDLAVEHKKTGRLQEAQDVVATLPRSAAAYHALGAALAENGLDHAAVAAFVRSLELDARRPQTHNSLGIVLARTGRRREARAAFEAALQLAPGDERARHNLQVLDAAGGER